MAESDLEVPFERVADHREGFRIVRYSVRGYWVRDAVRVEQSQSLVDFKFGQAVVSHGGGGRKTDSPLDAFACFQAALADAVCLARIWNSQSEEQIEKDIANYIERRLQAAQEPTEGGD